MKITKLQISRKLLELPDVRTSIEITCIDM